MATASLSMSPQILSLSSILKPKHNTSPIACKSLSIFSASRRKFCYQSPFPTVPLKTTRTWRISAFPQNIVLLEANPAEDSQLLDSTTGDGTSSIIQVLLFVAFIGLSILTIGVIYIAVTDFLQKRETDKFEKEEAANKKKSSKKGRIRARARAGPRGFGQKIEEDDDDAE